MQQSQPDHCSVMSITDFQHSSNKAAYYKLPVTQKRKCFFKRTSNDKVDDNRRTWQLRVQVMDTPLVEDAPLELGPPLEPPALWLPCCCWPRIPPRLWRYLLNMLRNDSLVNDACVLSHKYFLPSIPFWSKMTAVSQTPDVCCGSLSSTTCAGWGGKREGPFSTHTRNVLSR